MGIELAMIGATVGSSLLANRSAKNATNAQSQSAREANDLQRYMYDQNRTDTAPYRAAGNDALSQIQALLKNPNSITKSPDYQFGMNQGSQALQNSATSRGMTYSGAQSKALTRYGQDYAGSKLDQTYNRLASVAGIGQTGVNSSANAGGNYANNAGNNMIGMGNAQAANALARGSAYGNILNGTVASGQRAGWFGGGKPDPNLAGFGGTPNDPWYG